MPQQDTSDEQYLDAPVHIAHRLRAVARAAGWYWKVALALIVLSVAAGAAIALLMPKVYSSTNTVMVVTGNSNTLGDYMTADSVSLSKADSYMQLGGSPEVAQIAAESLDGTPVHDVAFSVVPGTSQIKVEGRSDSPEGSAKVADAYAGALTQEVQRIESIATEGNNYEPPSPSPSEDGGEEASPESSEDGTGLVQVVPVSSASVPESPVSPDLRLNLLVGVGVGLLLAALYVLARSLFDRKVRSSEAVANATGLAILGTIPLDKRLTAKRGVIPTAPPRKDREAWATSEAFRQLRTNLTFANVDDPPRTVVVTSSVAGEGKSSVAANLAVTLGALGQPTVLVDADLRRPVQTELFGLTEGAGLTDVLAGAAELEDVLQDWEPGSNVHLLGAGRTPPNPSELLGSKTMRNLLARMGQDYMVVIDSPPLLPVTDPSVLAKGADGVVIVTQANKTNLDDLTKAVARLHTVGATILGAVLNQVPRKGSGANEYGYYSDAYYYSSSSRH
ncbi:polysaccharide biosynthesis tyrosine autokinase [Kocuria soli]|uniref:non-specific protein-tyrosine kinase n=1 Tax=Kocuria soli TaxID=2485125 RepID=A0A3N3ZPU0_9MICC|nr:polysaccharide biosynthesis tyrosine autokinase [Kocuria soli]ROZ63043.1 polysaccharide biosynthesis tyrosine autokinase [Kocuria soli]